MASKIEGIEFSTWVGIAVLLGTVAPGVALVDKSFRLPKLFLYMAILILLWSCYAYFSQDTCGAYYLLMGVMFITLLTFMFTFSVVLKLQRESATTAKTTTTVWY